MNKIESLVERLHEEYPADSRGYTDRRQVAGYFDGDGSVGLVLGLYTVSLRGFGLIHEAPVRTYSGFPCA